MGCMSGEHDEMPVHEVTLSAFKMDAHEVTNAQYDSCVASGRCTPAHYNDSLCMIWNGSVFKRVVFQISDQKPEYPVTCITWQQAQVYCKTKGMKLPTEAQWEYAARATELHKYTWGDDPPSKERCASSINGGKQNVRNYKPNRWGLYDMTGNVWEWTNDYYEQGYYGFSDSSNPSGPVAGLYKVIRGGGWYSSGEQLRISNRHWFSPDSPEASLGFRCTKW